MLINDSLTCLHEAKTLSNLSVSLPYNDSVDYHIYKINDIIEHSEKYKKEAFFINMHTAINKLNFLSNLAFVSYDNEKQFFIAKTYEKHVFARKKH